MALQNYDFFSTIDQEGTTRGYKTGRALGKALSSIFSGGKGKKDTVAQDKPVAQDEPVNTAPAPSSADAWYPPMVWNKEETIGPQNQKTDSISGEFSNIGETLGGAFPDLDAKKGKLGWLPDWLEGKQGLLPDWIQGKQGLWPDYLPSMEWDAPPKLSGKLAEGIETYKDLPIWSRAAKAVEDYAQLPFFKNLAHNTYNFLGKQDVDETYYPEEIPMEDYLNKYGTSKPTEKDEQNMLLQEALHNALNQGTSEEIPFKNEYNIEDYLGGYK